MNNRKNHQPIDKDQGIELQTLSKPLIEFKFSRLPLGIDKIDFKSLELSKFVNVEFKLTTTSIFKNLSELNSKANKDFLTSEISRITFEDEPKKIAADWKKMVREEHLKTIELLSKFFSEKEVLPKVIVTLVLIPYLAPDVETPFYNLFSRKSTLNADIVKKVDLFASNTKSF